MAGVFAARTACLSVVDLLLFANSVYGRLLHCLGFRCHFRVAFLACAAQVNVILLTRAALGERVHTENVLSAGLVLEPGYHGKRRAETRSASIIRQCGPHRRRTVWRRLQQSTRTKGPRRFWRNYRAMKRHRCKYWTRTRLGVGADLTDGHCSSNVDAVVGSAAVTRLLLLYYFVFHWRAPVQITTSLVRQGPLINEEKPVRLHALEPPYLRQC